MNGAAVTFARHGAVLVATIDRPAARNALDTAVTDALVGTFEAHDRDPSVGCFVVTGASGIFAAGADIRELAAHSHRSLLATDHFARWDDFAALRTPKVAAVAGYALGGGCELAMMCDVILAAESARFGQPEIALGLMPGMGGTQRLTRLVGRAKAMDLVLTGRTMDAAEAERAGLVSRVVDDDALAGTALQVATTIAEHSRLTAAVAREAVRRADETSLAEGVLYERRGYFALFDTPDAVEGMRAFLDKRPPAFNRDEEGEPGAVD